MKSLKEALIKKHTSTKVSKLGVQIGDDLQDRDVVLFGYQHSYDKSYAYTNLGMYNAETENIEYDDGTYGPWENLKDNFQYFVHGMVYINHVLKIWRPKGDPVIKYPDELVDAKWMDKSKNYVTVYENKDLMKKFRLR